MNAELDETRIASLAEQLIAARVDGVTLSPPPAELVPASTAEAEAVDDRVAATTGWPVAGWKIGCTSAHAQQLLVGWSVMGVSVCWVG